MQQIYVRDSTLLCCWVHGLVETLVAQAVVATGQACSSLPLPAEAITGPPISA